MSITILPDDAQAYNLNVRLVNTTELRDIFTCYAAAYDWAQAGKPHIEDKVGLDALYDWCKLREPFVAKLPRDVIKNAARVANEAHQYKIPHPDEWRVARMQFVRVRNMWVRNNRTWGGEIILNRNCNLLVPSYGFSGQIPELGDVVKGLYIVRHRMAGYEPTYKYQARIFMGAPKPRR